jgi:hypothetical protein
MARNTWSTPLPRPIKIPQVMTLKTLADVRKLLGHIPTKGDAPTRTHCWTAASSVRPRDAQYSCVGCVAVIKPPTPDTPGSEQAASINAAGTTKYLTIYPRSERKPR